MVRVEFGGAGSPARHPQGVHDFGLPARGAVAALGMGPRLSHRLPDPPGTHRPGTHPRRTSPLAHRLGTRPLPPHADVVPIRRPQASTPDPTGGVQPGASNHEEAVDGPAGSPTVQPDPAAVTVGGDNDPTARNASTEDAGKQFDQAATTPERHRVAATRLRHHWWVLGADAAVIVVAAGVVVVTTSGVFGNTNNTGSISPPPLVPGKTYTETVNSPLSARTYSKPHTLSGEWKRVPNKTDVQVSCEITAPSAPNVGLYWYRIATPPWNNQYYSPANSFLNGDPPDGSAPTHVVDQAVPECPR
jgi:hypothetical protein